MKVGCEVIEGRVPARQQSIGPSGATLAKSTKTKVGPNVCRRGWRRGTGRSKLVCDGAVRTTDRASIHQRR